MKTGEETSDLLISKTGQDRRYFLEITNSFQFIPEITLFVFLSSRVRLVVDLRQMLEIQFGINLSGR